MMPAIDDMRTNLYPVYKNAILSVTRRERQILSKISEGHTTEEIGRLLFISGHTVLTYRKRLMIKLDATNAANLVRKGFEYGLLKM